MSTPLSIIVPLLDEAEWMTVLLAQLQPLHQRGCEVILVDGGSRDNTRALALVSGFTVRSARRGRARQMNAGAACATGRVLLFLHADTTLPADADALVGEALQSPERIWGRFDVRIEGRSRLLPVVAWFINRRSRWMGIATGDQAIFVRRSHFEVLGGFPDQDLMEDVELSARLRRRAWPVCLRQRVITSGRRWDRHGAVRTILLMWRLRFAYWLGASPRDLARLYR